MDILSNPLEAVQLIPIFTYLNLLSDFLLIARYLHEEDQTKQIPIVNGLYEYLEDNKYNRERKIKLIRHLLKGSDLYGEREDEYFDVTFANAMFDHIISSLVFDKYGGIYGFLATVFLNVVSLQVDQVLTEVLTNLEKETFENEHGEKSNLSHLAIGRIYNDIILPLFPITQRNLTLLSLDNIYAQAGLMFLRAGRNNIAYFIDKDSYDINIREENLFNQYLVTGQVIKKLVLTDEKNDQMLKAFALPALTYYICNSKYLFAYEKVENLISNTDFWQMAYKKLFQFINNSSNNIRVKLQNDVYFRMHMVLSTFENCSSEYFRSEIKNITTLFETYYYQLIENDISNYLLENFENTNFVVKLLVLNNTEEYENFSHKKFDILEFYFPYSNNFDYYILKQEDYHLVITNETDFPKVTANDIFIKQMHGEVRSVVLKTANESINILLENLTKYKKTRFEAHLIILNNCQGDNNQLKDDWWEEFGLSLIPYSQCLTVTCGTKYDRNRNTDNRNVTYTHSSDLFTKRVNNNTKNYLSFLGTTIQSVLLRSESSKIVYEIIRRRITEVDNVLNRSKIFDDVALNLNDPAFKLSFVNKDVVGLIKRIFFILNQKIHFSFKTVQDSLEELSVLKSRIYKGISTIGENNTRLVFVNTLNNRSYTGYGYKFIFLSSNTLDIAQFRTDNEFNDRKLLVLMKTKEEEGKTYMALNNVTLKPELDNVIYEVNNQLRRNFLKVLFYGVPIQDDDLNENCNNEEYFENWKNENLCRRRQRLTEKTEFEEEAFEYVRERTNLTEERIWKMLKKYTFPNKESLELHIDDWTNRNFKSEPPRSDQYKINSPGVLNTIRFHLSFETREIPNYDGEFRINAIYSPEEQKRIQENTTIRSIIESYNKQKGMYSLSFHDYYAIRNFATKGYTRITSNTNEAKLMKLALYKLAIRQSEDPIETFDLKLFRVESKPISLVELALSKRYTIFRKFTETYPSIGSAIRFAGYPNIGYMNVVYEMVFDGSYMRAKIEKIFKTKETSVILLPGSQFQIINNITVGIGGLGNVLKLKLLYQHSKNGNFDWYKNVTQEIVKINF